MAHMYRESVDKTRCILDLGISWAASVIPEERFPDTSCIEGWLSLRTLLDTGEVSNATLPVIELLSSNS
jgi:hypothetical protein